MTSLFDLSGKVALVTGSTQGLGLAIATGLAEHGAKLVVNGREAKKCDEVVAQLRAEKHIDAVAVAFDVSNAEEVRRGIARIEEEVGPIDILVNNAGMQRRHPFLEFPEADWDTLVSVNENSVFLVSQAVGQHMKERQRGKIINVCSMQSELGRDNITPYAATKGAVKMLTKGMCVELARYNIQVNGIGPGWFDTAILAEFLKNEGCRTWLSQRTPAGRCGQPHDLAGAAVFLASAASDFGNGHMLYVHGGFLAKM
ncbi:putative mitochondrial NAD or NADP dependent oxidoreductase [Leptomonas pyrrhocoris]|uniref:Putative mitochondrial NAD or NADP dependent oxidoreductase n=1 Tax=Leptomonas pyrrhocoris TaxID=157538 RepID=A0A0M9FRL7_LEPPY|nr:putative mitochondrial NAD or NADP dependent oxidoreductase [Leptomonas pyrrhocoris]KPA74519.1 putative mitochondrial NAD or NADP dependent oxidoreductase [Leptomonas pyrrhocoris]|eukprot:XP_015652958.1 putative mitochondrial NAD or NADP dependent oxidoreductase [Leptomonas pyrrhocoris]